MKLLNNHDLEVKTSLDFVNIADQCIKEKKHIEGIKNYLDSLNKDSSNFWALKNIGETYCNLGYYDKAIEFLLKAYNTNYYNEYKAYILESILIVRTYGGIQVNFNINNLLSDEEIIFQQEYCKDNNNIILVQFELLSDYNKNKSNSIEYNIIGGNVIGYINADNNLYNTWLNEISKTIKKTIISFIIKKTDVHTAFEISINKKLSKVYLNTSNGIQNIDTNVNSLISAAIRNHDFCYVKTLTYYAAVKNILDLSLINDLYYIFYHNSCSTEFLCILEFIAGHYKISYTNAQTILNITCPELFRINTGLAKNNVKYKLFLYKEKYGEDFSYCLNAAHLSLANDENATATFFYNKANY
jgi:hypothetical protein